MKQRNVVGACANVFLIVFFQYYITLRAETFAGINFRVFCVFWSISRKYMPLEIWNRQNTKVFLPKIKGNFWIWLFPIFLCFSSFFHEKTKHVFKNAKVFSTRFGHKIEKHESFCQEFRIFKARQSICPRKFLPLK